MRGAVILCGGRGRRMGGPKAWLPFGPERLLQRVVRLVAVAPRDVVVVAAPDQDLPALPAAVRVARDLVADQGPLRGLATGLAALPADVDLTYVTGTDAPFLDPGWVAHLAAMATDHEAAIAEVDGRRHPLAAIYRRAAALAAAEALLGAGERRLLALTGRLRTRFVAGSDLGPLARARAAVRNLNTPGDYRLALIEAGFDPGEPSDSARLFPRRGPG